MSLNYLFGVLSYFYIFEDHQVIVGTVTSYCLTHSRMRTYYRRELIFNGTRFAPLLYIAMGTLHSIWYVSHKPCYNIVCLRA